MPCEEPVVLDVERPVVVDGREVERIAHDLSIVVPTRIELVVIVIVKATYLIWNA